LKEHRLTKRDSCRPNDSICILPPLATIDQLDDPETREKAIGGVIAIIEYGREMKITAFEWNARCAGKVVMGIHMYMGSL
jgi:hypothetical protein